jgi:hypothetical protein
MAFGDTGTAGLINRRTWPDRLELQSATFEYIEAFYNRKAPALHPQHALAR